MEEVEIAKMKANDAILIENVKNSMTRITIIMVLFIIITTILIYQVFSDIARSNLYRKKLLTAKQDAEYLSTVKQRFLSNMSHEIRTPLQSIIGFSEQIMQQEKPSKESIESIFYSSEHLLQIVNEVLDYSRIVSGKFTFDNKQFNMNDLLLEVEAIMKLQADRKKIKLKFINEEPYILLYLGDPFRLKQILYNLIGNAIKFTNEGRISLEVKSSLKNAYTEFKFRINDSGIGISEADLKRIFYEFEQADTTGQHPRGGTGLGLNIVKGLVEEQEGTITAESKLHKGSSFLVTLTYKNADKIEIDDTKKLQTNKINFIGKVLIIDDDPFILKLFSTIFEKYSIKYTCQLSPEILLNQEWDNHISLIFMDIRMPGINGLELCKLVRTKIKKEVKIIALTAHVLQDEQTTILKQGFDGLITKPFKEADLISYLNDNTDEIKKVDLKALFTLCMEDPELLQKSLNSFISETTNDLIILKQLTEKHDNYGIMELFHKLAGRIGQIGDMPLSFKLRNIEKKFNPSTDYSNETIDFKEIVDEINLLVKVIKDEIDKP